MKKGGYFVFIFVILLIGVVFISSQQSSTKDPEKYGEDVDLFLDLPPLAQENFLKSYMDEFINGLKESENLYKLIDGVYVSPPEKSMSDDSKTKLLRKVIREFEDEDIPLKILEGYMEKIKEENPELYNSYYLRNFDSLEFEINPETVDFLEWEDGMLVKKNELGEVEAFIDFNDIPRALKRIEIFKEGGDVKFIVTTKDDVSSKVIKFARGGLDRNMNIMRPDGNRFGSLTKGIKSMRWNYDSKKLHVTYYDLNGEEQEIELGKDIFNGEEGEQIMDILENGDYDLGEKVEKAIGSVKEQMVNGKIESYVEEFLRNLDDINIEATITDHVNLGYRRKDRDSKGIREEMEFIFDEKGELTIKASRDSTIVTTNGKGVPLAVLGGNQDYSSDMEVLFNRHGELVGAKSAEGVIFDATSHQAFDFKVDSDKMVGVNIVRSTIADAITRGDWQNVVDIVEKYIGLRDVTNKEELMKMMNRLGPEMKTEAIKVLRAYLQDPNLNTEVKNRIQDVVGIFEDSFRESAYEIAGSILGDRKTAEQILENPDVQSLLGRNQENVREALNELVQPENINVLLDYYRNPSDSNRDRITDLVRNSLEENIISYDAVASSSLAHDLSRQVSLFSPGEVSPDPQDLQGKLNEFFESPEFRDIVEQGVTDESYEAVVNKFSNGLYEHIEGMSAGDVILGDVIEENDVRRTIEIIYPQNEVAKLDQAFRSFYSDVQSAVDVASQIKPFIERTEAGLRTMKQGRFEDQLVIDMQLGDIEYIGDQRVEVNTLVPLNRVDINHQGGTASEDVFILRNNGNLVVWVDGAETHGNRLNGKASMNDIYSIVNEAHPEHQFRLVSRGETYNLFDASDPGRVVKSSDYGRATVVGAPLIGNIPILASRLDIERSANIKDIGSDPNAKISITNIAQGQARGFIAWIAGVNQKVAKEAMKNPQKLSEFVPKIQAQLTQQASAVRADFASAGGAPLVIQNINNANEWLSFADEYGLQISNRQFLQDQLDHGLLIAQDSTNQRFISQFQPVLNFLNSQTLPRGSSLVFTNNGISVGGNSITVQDGVDSSVFRQLMRGMAENPSLMTAHRTIPYGQTSGGSSAGNTRYYNSEGNPSSGYRCGSYGCGYYQYGG
ncbi:hypothetical protein GF386_01405 [Candidatus Pacearchaeota archaeon]|nr:hypothetical protein [Candidatus Pacearchaeota archaeon]